MIQTEFFHDRLKPNGWTDVMDVDFPSFTPAAFVFGAYRRKNCWSNGFVSLSQWMRYQENPVLRKRGQS